MSPFCKTATLALLSSASAVSAQAAGVTYERLLNADKEPQNWLMNHRTYDAQRYSPLNVITKDNVKNLKLVYAVALGGAHGNEYMEATPVAEDGFIYVPDGWGVVYKIDGTKGNLGRIVWSMDPTQETMTIANRGVALWGDYVISVANTPARMIATNKDTGEIVWQTNVVGNQPRLALTAAPLPVKDRIIEGASGGDSGTRDWIAAFDGKTGKVIWQKYAIPAPGEPGAETWKGNNNAWETGGAAMYVTGSYDPDLNATFWGTGNPVPMFDAGYRPGDNLYTNSSIAWDVDTGAMKWFFQYTPGDMWDYDEEGAQVLINANVNGQSRKLLVHAGRNGFLYSLNPQNGQFVGASPYVEVNWTKGIDPKTGKPIDYDPAKDIQTYAGVANITPQDKTKLVCPTIAGGNNFWPPSYSRKTELLYIPSMTGCVSLTLDTSKEVKGNPGQGGGYVLPARLESDLVAADPLTTTVKKKAHLAYPNYAGAVSTAGGLVFTALTDGSVLAFDDTSLDQLWQMNMGVGFTAPPITFGVGGKQYVAVVSGLSGAAKTKLAKTPELREMRNATFLYVFGL